MDRRIVCKHRIKKNGREYTCNRFFGIDGDMEFVVRCPTCGRETVISKVSGAIKAEDFIAILQENLAIQQGE